MIRYRLRCHNAHEFDAWFQSCAAYEALEAGGHLDCPHCASANVRRAIMAPRIAGGGRTQAPDSAPPPP